jgi:hypothetical protein
MEILLFGLRIQLLRSSSLYLKFLEHNALNALSIAMNDDTAKFGRILFSIYCQRFSPFIASRFSPYLVTEIKIVHSSEINPFLLQAK